MSIIFALSFTFTSIFATSNIGIKKKGIVISSQKSKGKDNKSSIPPQINYQGYLTYENGNAVDTSLTIICRIYNTDSLGSNLWDETHNNVEVKKGIFNIILGNTNPIPDSIFASTERWLEIEIGSEKLTPRTKLTSIGYSFTAEKANTADYATNTVYADTADYAFSTLINYVDSAKVSTNSYKLEGQASSYYKNASNINTGTLDNARLSPDVSLLGQTIETSEITNGTITRSDVVSNFKAPYADTADYARAVGGITDTAKYSKDSDKLDGQQGSFYQNASNVNAGTLSDLRLSSNVSLLGQAIESSEITDGTIVNTDISGGAAINGSKISGWNDTDWNTAYTDRMKWDGGTTGLNASTGRTSLGLGSIATLNAVSGGTGGTITDGTIVNADVSSAAGISPSKISGTAWTSTNDGSGSGLDADLLDGQQASSFLSTSSDYGRLGVANDIYEGNTPLSSKYLGVNAKAADADNLDGQSGSYYQNASNINSGTLSESRLSGSVLRDGMDVGVSGAQLYLSGNQSSSSYILSVDNSGSGIGVNAYSSSGTALYAYGYNGIGVYGKTNAVGGCGVEAHSKGDNTSYPGLKVYGWASATGGWQTKKSSSKGSKSFISILSPNDEIYVAGTGTLINGQTEIQIDPTIASMISTDIPIIVNVTSTAVDCEGLCVIEKSNESFTVKELHNGHSNSSFDWILVGRSTN